MTTTEIWVHGEVSSFSYDFDVMQYPQCVTV